MRNMNEKNIWFYRTWCENEKKKKKKKNAYSFMRFRPELAFPYGGTVAIPVGAGSNVAASTTPYDASAIVIEFSTMRTRTVVRKSDHSTKIIIALYISLN